MNSTQSTTLRDALEAIRNLPRGTSGRIILERADEERMRAALAAADATDQGHELLAESDIVAIWQAMPGGPAGWLKSFGFLQFAREIEAAILDGAARPAPIGAVAPDAILAACYRVDWSSNEPAGAMLLAAMKEEIADLRAALKDAAPAAPIAEVTGLAEMEARKDAAYFERNQVVAALAKCFPSGKARTAIEGWPEDWHGCVYIDLPTGQVSWHYHDSQAHLFNSIPHYLSAWDGHDTDEKYRRLAALPATPSPLLDTIERERVAGPNLGCDCGQTREWCKANDCPDLASAIQMAGQQWPSMARAASTRQQSVAVDGAPSTNSAAEQDARLATQGMADCMDMVRGELIEAGIIDKSVAPMFIANAVGARLAAAEVAADRWAFIEDNATTEGGGKGFMISCWVPVDHEDMGCGIDAAIATMQQSTTPTDKEST